MDHQGAHLDRTASAGNANRSMGILGNRSDRYRHPAVIAEDFDRSTIEVNLEANRPFSAFKGTFTPLQVSSCFAMS